VSFFNAHDYFLFVQSEDKGNSVIGIDKATGTVKTFIPARQKLYEGEERPYIDYVCIMDNHMLIFVYYYDGTNYDSRHSTVYSAPMDNPVYSNWKKTCQYHVANR